MEVIRNTLYVLTPGTWLRRDHEAVVVEIDRQKKLSVPLHNLESIVLFGHGGATAELMAGCAERGIALTFLSQSGRLLARVDAPVSGNVLLRRAQFRKADDPAFSCALARNEVAGKLQNARANLLRAARDDAAPEDGAVLREAADAMARELAGLGSATTTDAVRGHEGMGAKVYFEAFSHMVRQEREHFALKGRTRRPPLDRTNCLLSFVYALLLPDCVAALTGAGLDPNVGFLHGDRAGRPSLALDLMEEFRPVADRVVLSLINRKQVGPSDFISYPNGAMELTDKSRRAVVSAWQERKQDEVTHPLLGQRTRLGLLPHLQAKILAQHVRGELPEYVPCVLK